MNPKLGLTVKLLSRTVVHIYTRGEGKMAKKVPIRSVWR